VPSVASVPSNVLVFSESLPLWLISSHTLFTPAPPKAPPSPDFHPLRIKGAALPTAHFRSQAAIPEPRVLYNVKRDL